MTSILDRLKNLKSASIESTIDAKYITPEELEHRLKRLGCDEYIISDVLEEPPERWMGYLDYFEDKQRG